MPTKKDNLITTSRHPIPLALLRGSANLQLNQFLSWEIHGVLSLEQSLYLSIQGCRTSLRIVNLFLDSSLLVNIATVLGHSHHSAELQCLYTLHLPLYGSQLSESLCMNTITVSFPSLVSVRDSNQAERGAYDI